MQYRKRKVIAELFREMFYEREQIKTQYCKQKVIAELFRELFYEQEQIKTKYCQQTFIAELFRGREKMFYEERKIRMRCKDTKRRKE